MNERMTRAAPKAAAEFITAFSDGAGQLGDSTWLVWAYEGDYTLADLMAVSEGKGGATFLLSSIAAGTSCLPIEALRLAAAAAPSQPKAAQAFTAWACTRCTHPPPSRRRSSLTI